MLSFNILSIIYKLFSSLAIVTIALNLSSTKQSVHTYSYEFLRTIYSYEQFLYQQLCSILNLIIFPIQCKNMPTILCQVLKYFSPHHK